MIQLKNKKYNEKHSIIISIGIALVVLVIYSIILSSVISTQKQIERIRATEKYVYFQSSMENFVYSNINLLRGYIAYLSTKEEMTEEDTIRFLDELLKNNKENIRNIGIIEDTTIKWNYPKEGNEEAIGVDLGLIDKQKENVLKVKETLQYTAQGPVDLVQGGVGFIIRSPVIKDEQYWGQVSVVIDGERFYRDIKSYEDSYNIDVLIYNNDEDVPVRIYGNESLINSQNLKFTYQADLLNWIIYIQPKGGWGKHNFQMVILLLVGLSISMTIGDLAFFLQRNSVKIKYQANHDQLTGLYNRNYLNIWGTKILENARNNGTKVGIMMLDINKFKQINDIYGHKIGDEVLKEFSFKLKDVFTQEEKVIRLGGDEFLILFTEIKCKEELAEAVDMLRKSINGNMFIEEFNILVSSSIGFSTFPDDGDSIDAVIHQADLLMYKEKNKKR